MTTNGASPTAAAAGTITVNDAPRPVGAATHVAAIAAELGLAERRGVAVAVNGEVVPRARWSDHPLRAGDRVLVIRATQGG